MDAYHLIPNEQHSGMCWIKFEVFTQEDIRKNGVDT